MTRLIWLHIAILVAGSALLIGDPAAAQRHPFAVGGQEAISNATGLAGLILAWQTKFHTELQQAARALSNNPNALGVFLASCFAYGVFHAAGPGHGKAVLTSYMIANETALRRGLALTLLAALFQGFVAIGLVSIAALLFKATSSQMQNSTHAIEFVSYVAIFMLGARLTWLKGSALVAILRPSSIKDTNRFSCAAIGDSLHAHDSNCGHIHAPDPTLVAGPDFYWRDAIATIIAAGLRPCSGAILILIFTLSQNMFAAGVLATLAMSLGAAVTTSLIAIIAVYAKGAAIQWSGVNSHRGLIISKSIEVVAALLVVSLGAILLIGIAATQTGT